MKEIRKSQKNYIYDLDAMNNYIKKEELNNDLKTRIQDVNKLKFF